MRSTCGLPSLRRIPVQSSAASTVKALASSPGSHRLFHITHRVAKCFCTQLWESSRGEPKQPLDLKHLFLKAHSWRRSWRKTRKRRPAQDLELLIQCTSRCWDCWIVILILFSVSRDSTSECPPYRAGIQMIKLPLQVVISTHKCATRTTHDLSQVPALQVRASLPQLESRLQQVPWPRIVLMSIGTSNFLHFGLGPSRGNAARSSKQMPSSAFRRIDIRLPLAFRWSKSPPPAWQAPREAFFI